MEEEVEEDERVKVVERVDSKKEDEIGEEEEEEEESQHPRHGFPK